MIIDTGYFFPKSLAASDPEARCPFPWAMLDSWASGPECALAILFSLGCGSKDEINMETFFLWAIILFSFENNKEM